LQSGESAWLRQCGWAMDEPVPPDELARRILQAILDDMYPLSDELFRRRSWVHGANPGFYGSSLTEVVCELDWKIPYLTGELAPHTPLDEHQLASLREFYVHFMKFVDERLPQNFGACYPREELAVDGWHELTQRAKGVLEEISRNLGSDYRVPPNVKR